MKYPADIKYRADMDYHAGIDHHADIECHEYCTLVHLYSVHGLSCRLGEVFGY